MDDRLAVAVLEPYYGGSHAAFVDVFVERSRHRVTVAGLPARKWKWRMRGAATWFAREDNGWLTAKDGAPVDVILCNDMLAVADLRALLPSACRNIPMACYFHENQLTYPIPDEQQRDYQYGMTNITSCLAADAVWFNSSFHRNEFLQAAGGLLAKMPDFVPSEVIETIHAKSDVRPPPVAVEFATRSAKTPDSPLTILWPHRWEYDKNPEPFFEALIRLADRGFSYGVILVGEQFRTAPPVFADSWNRLERHIIHAGYLPSRTDYLNMLRRSDIVVSTAIQENFGIAVVEAILAGCQPLLPNRLAYPELIPADLHQSCLYPTDDTLFDRLSDLVAGRMLLPPDTRERLRSSLEARFGADAAVKAIDDGLSELAQRHQSASKSPS